VKIRGGEHDDIEMICDRMGQDLIDGVMFQKQFALAVCNALKSRFEDNHIMAMFRVLGSRNMPSKQVGLASWRVVDLDLLCGQYGVDCEIEKRRMIPIVNFVAIKREFFAFKLQATTDWLDKRFKDVWSIITWNYTLKVKV